MWNRWAVNEFSFEGVIGEKTAGMMWELFCLGSSGKESLCFLKESNHRCGRFQPPDKYFDKQGEYVLCLRSRLSGLMWEGEFASVQLKDIFTLIIHYASGLRLSVMQSFSHQKASQCASTKISECIAQNVLNSVWHNLIKSHSALKDYLLLPPSFNTDEPCIGSKIHISVRMIDLCMEYLPDPKLCTFQLTFLCEWWVAFTERATDM